MVMIRKEKRGDMIDSFPIRVSVLIDYICTLLMVMIRKEKRGDMIDSFPIRVLVLIDYIYTHGHD
jgi:hypothetical protein